MLKLRASVQVLLIATLVGCTDGSEPPPIAEPVRPVKTLLVAASGKEAGMELPGRVRAAAPIDLAFEEASGTIVELPACEREGQEIQKGELLAQIDPKGFRTALSEAEDSLTASYSALDLATAENLRMEKMKGINPDLVSTTMLERTRENLRQAEAGLKSLESAVAKAEHRLADTSLRAPFAGIITRCLMERARKVKAGEPIVRLQDVTHLEVLVQAPATLTAMARTLGPEGLSASIRFAGLSDENFPLRLKDSAPDIEPAASTAPLVLKMPKPRGVDLPPGTTGTVSLRGKGEEMRAVILVPAIAVMTDPNGQDYLWLVRMPELQAERRDIQVGRLAGSDQIQVLSGLAGGERIVVAGVTQLAKGRRVRLWEDVEADKNQ